jgi:5-methylcytosine-specific restriction endonuclease McrA
MLYRRSFMSRAAFEEKPLEIDYRRWLIWQLDILTSRIVRGRDRKCVTCGTSRNLQCSHFYSRRYLATRFDLRNCHAMCVACNRRHNEDSSAYMEFMKERYGPAVIEELNELKKSFRKVTDEELRQMLGCYKTMI